MQLEWKAFQILSLNPSAMLLKMLQKQYCLRILFEHRFLIKSYGMHSAW